MRDYSLAHLSNECLLHDLGALVERERGATVDVLVHIAEVDARKLYAPAGYSSMHAYCVGELRLSEDAAFKRIRAARAGRRMPILFAALAKGRIHLAAAYLLAPYLTPENVDEVLKAVTHRRKSEVEELVAARFQKPEETNRPAASIRPLPPSACGSARSEHRQVQDALAALGQPPLGPAVASEPPDAAESTMSTEPDSGPRAQARELAPGPVVEATPVVATCVEKYLVRLTIGRSLHDKLRHAQALLSHSVPSGDVAEVLERALATLITTLEKQKLGSGVRRSSRPRPASSSRYIPAAVRRAVWNRDQAQCTFVSTTGHRCGAKDLLQFDHVEPHARRSEPTVENLRLRCHTHNQLEAERVFGTEFMTRKREGAVARSRRTVGRTLAGNGDGRGVSQSSDRALPSESAAPRSG